jgi:PPP family 3-phenylpropionic acid transporter
MLTQNRGIPRTFYAYYFAVYCGTAISTSFFSLFFLNAGMSSSQLGWLFGVAPLMGFLAQPVFGYIGDRAKYKNYALWLILGGSALFIALFPVSNNLIYISIIYILFTAVNNCAIPMQDAITLDYVSEWGGNFSGVRLYGTLGYVFMCIVSGLILNRFQDAIFIVYFACLIGALAMAITLPKVRGYRRKGQKVKLGAIIRQKRMFCVLMLVLAIYTALSFFGTFYSPYMLQNGGNRLMIGIGTAMMAASEIPFYFRGGARRLFERFGLGRILFVSALVMSLRWLITGLTSNPVVIMFANMLHGFPITMMAVGVVEYINECVPPEMKASGQMLLTLFSIVIARGIGNVLGGAVVQWIDTAGGNGIATVFLIFAPVVFITALLCGIPLIRMEKEAESAA